MIEIIDGVKGSGKTTKMIEWVNKNSKSSKGVNVVLTTTTRYRSEIGAEVRFIDVKEEGINNLDRLVGFIKGMICANYDIEYVFIDGVYKMLGTAIDSAEMASFFLVLEELGQSSMVHFVLTISCDRKELPGFIAKYV